MRSLTASMYPPTVSATTSASSSRELRGHLAQIAARFAQPDVEGNLDAAGPSPGRPNCGASPGQQPVATRMSPDFSSVTRNVPSARMARPWAALTLVTSVLTDPDDRVTALIVPPPLSAT
jgi:hypothetical protein